MIFERNISRIRNVVLSTGNKREETGISHTCSFLNEEIA